MSILAVAILTIKFGVSAMRRWGKRHIIPWDNIVSLVEPISCLILIFPKVPVLVFSIQQDEKLVQVFLSLAARFLIIYQVRRFLRWKSCADLVIFLSAVSCGYSVASTGFAGFHYGRKYPVLSRQPYFVC